MYPNTEEGVRDFLCDYSDYPIYAIQGGGVCQISEGVWGVSLRDDERTHLKVFGLDTTSPDWEEE